MKEFIEKQIERLEELSIPIYDSDGEIENKVVFTDIAKNIVNELAEEFGKDTNVTTNADRIRSMTDEELAEFLYDTNHYFENDRYLVRFGGEIVQDEEISILDWLQSEVEGVTENE